MATYLNEPETAELRRLTGNYNWTVTDMYHAQALRPYETTSLGYSDFCQLFDYDDCVNFAYLMDIEFAVCPASIGLQEGPRASLWLKNSSLASRDIS